MLKIRFKPGLLSFVVVGMLATLIHIILFTILKSILNPWHRIYK